MIRLAIVGCSVVIEEGHGPALAADPRFSIEAVVDPIAARASLVGDLLGVAQDRRFTTHEALEPADIDVALVATPPNVRRPIIIDLVSRGLDVVSEKPLATTMADADAILAAVESHGRKLVMVHNYPHLDEYRAITDAVETGAIGAVEVVLFRALGSPGRPGAAEYDPQWKRDPRVAGGGRMLDLGVHALSVADALFGERCRSVIAEVERPPGGADERCFAIYRYPHGTAVCEIGAGHGSAVVEVIGAGGRVSLDYAPLLGSFSTSPIARSTVGAGKVVTTDLEPRDQFPPAFYDHVFTVLTSEGDSGDGAHGRDLLELVHAAYLSAHEGRSVELPLDPQSRLYRLGVSAIWDHEARRTDSTRTSTTRSTWDPVSEG